MFYKYDIKNINGEECLYLFLSLKYEFSDEFINNYNLGEISKNYISINKIPFKGKKIYYVVNGIVVKSMNLNDSKYIICNNYAPDYFLINIKYDDGSICEITLREYLLGILFNYYNDNIGDEVLKSICVLFNTYSYKMMKENKYILANNSFNTYINYKEYDLSYKDYNSIIRRLNNIINSVSCIYLSYNKSYILPFIHFCNTGKTLANNKYPYLSSVNSLWDLSSSKYININDYSYKTISHILKTKIDKSTVIKVNNSNILFGEKSFSVTELKSLLNLSSNYINIIVNKDYIRFITIGVGNSLGLSIYGSISIENNGGSYNEILNYYFPKTKLFKHIKELS